MTLKYHFGKVFEELNEEFGITKNAIAVEGRIRPATVAKYERGEIDRIETTTLIGVLDAVNNLSVKRAKEEGKTPRIYNLSDVISYQYKGAE